MIFFSNILTAIYVLRLINILYLQYFSLELILVIFFVNISLKAHGIESKWNLCLCFVFVRTSAIFIQLLNSMIRSSEHNAFELISKHFTSNIFLLKPFIFDNSTHYIRLVCRIFFLYCIKHLS